jgi:hypothetical protein
MITYIIFVLLGSSIVLLLNLNEALPKSDFGWSKFIKANLASFLLNMLIGVTVVYAEYGDPKPLFPLTNISALMLGAAAQVIFKKLINVFTTDKSTFIGNNGKDS